MSGTPYISNRITANGGVIVLGLIGQGAAGIQVSGTWVGTLEFEAAVGETMLAVYGMPINGTTAVTSATANGVWRVDVAGLRAVQVRASAWTSGSALITIQSAPPSTSSSSASGAMSIADGADVAEGATTDAKVTGDNTGTVSAKLRGINYLINLVTDTVNNWFKVSIQNSTLAVTKSTDPWEVDGLIAHGTANTAGNKPLANGYEAIAHGTNPTAVAAAAQTKAYANRAGVPFILGGHPNIVRLRANYTAAQTDTAAVTVASGLVIVVTACSFMCSNANTVNVSVVVGFGAANTPTTTGVVLAHPNVAAGSGVVEGSGSGILGVGTDGQDLRITCSAPTTGSADLLVSYFTIES